VAAAVKIGIVCYVKSCDLAVSITDLLRFFFKVLIALCLLKEMQSARYMSNVKTRYCSVIGDYTVGS
jgi:hypothetical protein